MKIRGTCETQLSINYFFFNTWLAYSMMDVRVSVKVRWFIFTIVWSFWMRWATTIMIRICDFSKNILICVGICNYRTKINTTMNTKASIITRSRIAFNTMSQYDMCVYASIQLYMCSYFRPQRLTANHVELLWDMTIWHVTRVVVVVRP